MKFSIATVLSAAAVVSAEAVFKVSDFSAACIQHSSQCSYSFGVIQAGNGETTPVQCSAMAGSDGTLPAIAKGTCKESARTWTVDKTADGLKLTVSQMVTPSSSQSGSHSIPKSQLKIEQSGASSAQSYTGPAAFDLE